VVIALDGTRMVGVVDLYLYGDRGLAAPQAYAIEIWDGRAWVEAPERSRSPRRPTAWAMNRVLLDPIETDRVRISFDHDPPARSAVTEIMIREREP
jgi:hypothetical protein